MKRILLTALLAFIVLGFCFALSDDAKFTYSVISDKEQVKRGSPYKEKALEVAQETGTIRFYFMHGEGLQMSSTSTKWGDATLIVFPNGQTMLIDAGMAAYGKTLVHNIKQMGIKQLDYVILSHNHPDHFGGLFDSNGILSSFKVVNFYWNGLNCDYNKNQANVFTNGMKKYAKKIQNVTVLSAGDTIEISDDIHIEILNPTQEQKDAYLKLNEGLMSEAMNSESLAVKLTYKDFSAIFCGDMYQNREEYMVETYGPEVLNVDLVKANHHGTDASNGRKWAQATSPRVAVAMYGYQMAGTAYGNYAETGAYVFAEYFDGYIRVVSDGETYCDVTRSKQRSTTLYTYYDMIAQSIYPPQN